MEESPEKATGERKEKKPRHARGPRDRRKVSDNRPSGEKKDQCPGGEARVGTAEEEGGSVLQRKTEGCPAQTLRGNGGRKNPPSRVGTNGPNRKKKMNGSNAAERGKAAKGEGRGTPMVKPGRGSDQKGTEEGERRAGARGLHPQREGDAPVQKFSEEGGEQLYKNDYRGGPERKAVPP